MSERRLWMAAALLALQGGFVYWTAAAERAPAPPDLGGFPQQFDGWVRIRDDRLDASLQSQLGADRLLSRSYLHLPAGPFANLFVAWFGSQRDGRAQPHSPKVCLPGNGWIPEASGYVTLRTRAGGITVNRYVIANRGSRALVLYWFQTPRRTIASEWAAKFWLAADALRDRRTDTALVRVSVALPAGSERDAELACRVFARDVYPLLRSSLPSLHD